MAQIDPLLKFLRENDGSDLHLAAGLEPRVRIHGRMRPIGDWPRTNHDMLLSAFREIAPANKWREFLDTRDVDFAYSIPGLARFRANLFAQENGLAGVFRIIPEAITPLEALNLPGIVETFAHLPNGLVLCTGATGSGKSTTLAALIDVINERYAKHIITIEDPLEFVHANKTSVISHREIDNHTNGFAPALRAALRQDPDVILVGEMRDPETISLALEAAETGALVFSSLHANTAPGAVDRIVGVFPAEQHGLVRSILAETLRGVVAQILLPTADGAGRQAAVEIMSWTPALPNVIRDGNMAKIYTLAGSSGMRSLDANLAELANAGVVKIDDARAKAHDPFGFDRKLDRSDRG